VIEKKLESLLKGVADYEIKGAVDIEIKGMVLDSRKIEKGFLYTAVVGTIVDGHQYIKSSIDRGAKAILCEEWPDNIDKDIGLQGWSNINH